MHSWKLLLWIMLFVGTAEAQYRRPEPQSVIDALQDQRLGQLEGIAATNRHSIDRTDERLREITSRLDEMTGVGKGVGAIFAILQAVQIFLSIKAASARRHGE